MNKIDELLAELLPKWGIIQKGKRGLYQIKRNTYNCRKMKEIACDDGEIKVFAGGKTVINAHERKISLMLILQEFRLF